MAVFDAQVLPADDGTLHDGGGWAPDSVAASEGYGVRALVRFPGVPIPRGATITSATLTLVAYAETGTATTVLAVAADNVPTMATGVVGFTPTYGPTSSLSGTTRAYNVTALVESLTTRAGWSAGNAIAFMARTTSGVNVADFRADGHASRARLVVDYVVPPAVIASATLTGAGGTPTATTVAPVVPPAVIAAAALTGAGGAPSASTFAPPTAGFLARAELTGAGGTPTASTTRPSTVVAAALTGAGGTPTARTTRSSVIAHAMLTGAGGTPSATVVRPAVPPPPPWREWVRSAEYREVISRQEREVTFRVEVLDYTGAVLARLGGDSATHDGPTGGSVTVDSDIHRRASGTLLITDPTLTTAVSPTDLLHPYANTRVRIIWRERIAPGRWGEVPLATLCPLLPNPILSVDDPGPVLALVCEDVMDRLDTAGYRATVNVGGMLAHDAIAAVLDQVAPGWPRALTPSDHAMPDTYEAGQVGDSPVPDLEAIAEAAGMEVYADREGVIVTRPLTAGGAPVASWGQDDGLVASVTPTIDAKPVNRVVVTSASPDVDPPVTGSAQDDDPTSPLWVGRPGTLTHTVAISNPIVLTAAQADTMARNELRKRQEAQFSADLMVWPDPARDPGDVVSLDWPGTPAVGAHRVAGTVIDMSTTALMGAVVRGSVAW